MCRLDREEDRLYTQWSWGGGESTREVTAMPCMSKKSGKSAKASCSTSKPKAAKKK